MKLNGICVICLLLQMSRVADSSNILGLFTSAHRSHMLVYISVIKSLINRGHNMTIITVMPIDDMLPKNIRIIQLRTPPKPENVHGIFRQIAVVTANGKTFNDPRFHQFLSEDNQFDLVVLGYLFNDYQLGVAAHFSCPSVVIWTTQPISFVNRFIGNPNGWSYVPQPFVRSQCIGLKGVLYGIFETVFTWIFDFIMNSVYRELFPPDKYPALENMRRNVSLVLCNHHFSEGPIAAHLPSLIEISGIQIERNDRLTEALQHFMDSADNGVIYFSLGTVVSPKQLKTETLNILFKVFSSLPQRVIWKIDRIPKDSPNILIGKWFPQNTILSHHKTKLFITHGGKGSTTESLYFAVPMIAIPIFGDQFGDAYRLKKNGFGLTLTTDKLTEPLLREYIYEVLNNDTYSNNIKKASQIYKDRPLTSEKTAIYWIEYVIRYKGATHLQTPLKHMNFVQYFNIDVCLFVLILLYAVAAALKGTTLAIYNILKSI